MIRKYILMTAALLLVMNSCGDHHTSGEEADKIISLVASGDFSALEEKAPFLSELDDAEKTAIQQALSPYDSGQYNLEVRRQGFRTETLFLTSYEKDPRTLVMTMSKSKGQWVLKNNISFKQTIGFIPLEE